LFLGGDDDDDMSYAVQAMNRMEFEQKENIPEFVVSSHFTYM
jgi:hypothetical protein